MPLRDRALQSGTDPLRRQPAKPVLSASVDRATRMPAAGDQLLGLDEEFDFANAASPKLDIVARDGDFAMPAINVDLPLHRMDVRDGGEIHGICATRRATALSELLSPASISPAHGRALDHGRAFPVLSAMLVIIETGRHRDRNLGRRWIWPQAQIDAKRHSRRRCVPAAASQVRA